MFTTAIFLMLLVHGTDSIRDIPGALFLLMGISDGIILGGVASAVYKRLKNVSLPSISQRKASEILRDKLYSMDCKSKEHIILLEIICELEKQEKLEQETL